MATGGQCRDCFDRFKSIHLGNHIQELRDASWLQSYAMVELGMIKEFEKAMSEKEKKKASS
jgi:hypothetical protein